MWESIVRSFVPNDRCYSRTEVVESRRERFSLVDCDSHATCEVRRACHEIIRSLSSSHLILDRLRLMPWGRILSARVEVAAPCGRVYDRRISSTPLDTDGGNSCSSASRSSRSPSQKSNRGSNSFCCENRSAKVITEDPLLSAVDPELTN